MSLQQFLATLRARFGLALLVFAATVAAAVVTTLLMPKRYVATASMIIDTSKPDPLTGSSNGGNPSPALQATQISVLLSERVAQDVVRSLRLTEQPTLRDKWTKATKGRGSFDDWLARGLLKTVAATPSHDSNVIDIEAKSNDPVQAAAVANAFARSYLAISLKLRVEPAQQYSSFFASQASDLRAQVERAQERLSTFQRDKGVIVSDDRLDGEVSRMNELSARLNRPRGDAAAGQGATLALRNDPVLSGLRSDLGRAEDQLQEFSVRWGDKHPQVVQARARVAALRNQLDAEQQRVKATLVSPNDPARQNSLRRDYEAQRARVLNLRSAREDGLVLLRDVENAQRAYDSVQVRLSQSTLESHATQGNAFVLTEATPPIYPSEPKVLVNMGLAVVVGLALAMGAVLLLEQIDPRLRTDDAALAMLGQPLLGVLPKPGVRGHFATRRIPLVTAQGLSRSNPRG